MFERTTTRIWHILCIAKHICEFKTACKSIIIYLLYAITDGHRGQTTAVLESADTDGCHAIGDGHGGQTTASSESAGTDGCHAVPDGHGGQTTASSESIIPNVTVLDGHRC